MAFTYDAVGNRLTGPVYSKANTFLQSDSYDYDNRIVSATKQVTGNPNADTVTFKYDPFGRRIEKNVATFESGIPTTYKYTYVYDNEDIILEVLERTQNGNTTTTTTAYTHGPGIDEPLSLTRDGQTWYYHADGLGSITSITDSAQAVVNRYAYDSFGSPKSAETIRNAYAYTGREYDSETGLYYYRARYYDPEAGRFVSKDPIGFAGGDVNVYGYVDSVGKPLTETNLYLYANANPVTYTDPLGLFPVVPAIAACLSNPSCARALMAGIAATAVGIQNAIDNLTKEKSKSEQCPSDNRCEEQALIDEGICRNLNNPSSRARCWASANERYGACRAGRPIPPLVIW